MTVRQDKEPWPVYYWMWGTGIVFFFITYTGAHLYLIPYFRESMVREIMVQWKSYGALTGSWNMLVYGTALYLATRIGGSDVYARSKMAFGLFFLGLFNLMFGWAHQKNKYCNAYRFLFAADIWVFINLGLALIISVPALNLFTHGTHITVAHAMGSTIGINSMILLASIFYVIREELSPEVHAECAPQIKFGFWTANISLAVFFSALILAGVGKGLAGGLAFQEMMQGIRPFLLVFAVSGITLMIGLWIVLWHGFRLLGQVQRGDAPAKAELSPA